VSSIAIAGLAALVAGALSMAAGEYVSVSSQRDAEQTALARGQVIESVVEREHEAELTNPWHAAIASFIAFLLGGVVPLAVVLLPWGALRVPATFAAVAVALVVTGLVSARFSGARPQRSVLRNVVGGSLAMAVTWGVGALVGLAV
jgi:VIT1/CCC1 family predicted Fe2+/Mn2+ transporter